MIPKVIHYIWLGGKPLPKFIKRCIKSWKKFCPDYKIKRWDETNLNLDECKFAKDAYKAKKFAFASDYFRFKILHEQGGIYLDVDVELIKSLDDLLGNETFTGFEYGDYVAPGLIMGATKDNNLCKEIMDKYQVTKFDINHLEETTVCIIVSEILKKYGLILNNTTQDLNVCKVYSTEYFCPKKFREEQLNLTPNTYSIHHYYGSWVKKPPLYKRIKWAIGRIVRRVLRIKK